MKSWRSHVIKHCVCVCIEESTEEAPACEAYIDYGQRLVTAHEEEEDCTKYKSEGLKPHTVFVVLDCKLV